MRYPFGQSEDRHSFRRVSEKFGRVGSPACTHETSITSDHFLIHPEYQFDYRNGTIIVVEVQCFLNRENPLSGSNSMVVYIFNAIGHLMPSFSLCNILKSWDYFLGFWGPGVFN